MSSQVVADLWPLFLSLIFLVAWAVRLESKVKNNGEKIEAAKDADRATNERVGKLEVKHDSLDSKVVEQLAQVRESLARIEGALGVRSANQT